MYFPLQIKKFLHSDDVRYKTYATSAKFSEDISYYWNLKSNNFVETFNYVVLPDACIDIIFDFSNPNKPDAFISSPFVTVETIALSGKFDFWGIRFYPGKITKYIHTPVDQLESPFTQLDQVINSSPFSNLSSENFLQKIEDTISKLTTNTTPYTQKIAPIIDNADLLRKNNYSERQIRRIVKEITGISPIQLKKIIRFQNTLADKDRLLDQYFDQSHYIKDFKEITGLTPKEFFKKYSFDSRKE